ncbi:MAG: phycobiliprotein lyase [Cyanobacteria bacterium J083]|nr:MAG: phycobiliprotein lyase [Cyanobacteria bacterium J083]
MDAMDFFVYSAGKWRSQRTTHHLPFRRAENGTSDITVETLLPEDPKIIEICQMHKVDPSLSMGGAYVCWDGSMAWDREEENHQGSTVFALIPETEDRRQGKLLRERGYAEIVPVAGQYQMDAEDGLVLVTEYETMSIIERFWFINPNLRLRSSTVKRFGGFNTATFCAETRVQAEAKSSSKSVTASQPAISICAISGW